MQKVAFPRSEAQNVLSALLCGERFEVLAEATLEGFDCSVLVLGRFGWGWGHFFRAAFCKLAPSGENESVLEVSYLDVQRQWFGKNIFRSQDRSIEKEIADYVLRKFANASPASRLVEGTEAMN